MGKQQSLESALNPDKSPAKKNKKQPKIQDSDDSEAEESKQPPKKKVKQDSEESSSAKVDSKELPSKPSSAESQEPAKDDNSGSGTEEDSEEDSDGSEDEEDHVQDDQAAKQTAAMSAGIAKKPPPAPVDLGKAPEWKAGEPVPYAALVYCLQQIESTTKRLEISSYLTAFLRTVIDRTPSELLYTVYLCINRLCPDYEGLELGIGESLLIKAISGATGRKPDQIKAEYKKVGDLGTVAQQSRSKQPGLGFFKPKSLTVTGTFKSLKQIAGTEGKGSQGHKVGIINKLLASCQGVESKFIIRSLEGKLRIGLAEKTVLVSLAHAAALNDISKNKLKLDKEATAEKLETASETVKGVFSELPNYDLIVPALLEHGIGGLREHCKLTPGTPLKPMLAKPTKAITEVLDRFEGKQFTCEFKYDGERAQVHYSPDGEFRVFSRNSEDMSKKYPDLMVSVPKCVKKDKTQSFVFDSEVVAWDSKEKKLLPFQELSRRKRKDVKAEDVSVKVHLFAFDLLYLNGESLLRKDLSTRRNLLREHFEEVEGEFAFAKWSDANNVEQIQSFLDHSIEESCEGLMVKMLEGEDAYYEPSRRSMNWLKVKKDYLAGSGDSFDLAVIGGYYGRGKRTDVYGAFLLACWDPEGETYQAICKIGTGFSEEQLSTFHGQLNPLEVQQKKSYYNVGEAKPDVYFQPKYVWEVKSADLSLSPVYTAAKGLVEGGRGISLRFPRLIRIRDDKKAEQATDNEQVSEAYERQAATTGYGGKSKKKGGEEAGDDYW